MSPKAGRMPAPCREIAGDGRGPAASARVPRSHVAFRCGRALVSRARTSAVRQSFEAPGECQGQAQSVLRRRPDAAVMDWYGSRRSTAYAAITPARWQRCGKACARPKPCWLGRATHRCAARFCMATPSWGASRRSSGIATAPAGPIVVRGSFPPRPARGQATTIAPSSPRPSARPRRATRRASESAFVSTRSGRRKPARRGEVRPSTSCRRVA